MFINILNKEDYFIFLILCFFKDLFLFIYRNGGEGFRVEKRNALCRKILLLYRQNSSRNSLVNGRNLQSICLYVIMFS